LLAVLVICGVISRLYGLACLLGSVVGSVFSFVAGVLCSILRLLSGAANSVVVIIVVDGFWCCLLKTFLGLLASLRDLAYWLVVVIVVNLGLCLGFGVLGSVLGTFCGLLSFASSC